jgi:hypothetical protein
LHVGVVPAAQQGQQQPHPPGFNAPFQLLPARGQGLALVAAQADCGGGRLR